MASQEKLKTCERLSCEKNTRFYFFCAAPFTVRKGFTKCENSEPLKHKVRRVVQLSLGEWLSKNVPKIEIFEPVPSILWDFGKCKYSLQTLRVPTPNLS